VRSTQLAFQHNERTLEMGLRMAETLRDGVQALASSQADWIKSLASARGFFRGSPGSLPPVKVKQLTVHAAMMGRATRTATMTAMSRGAVTGHPRLPSRPATRRQQRPRVGRGARSR
jgi:hypothetical protein